MPIVALALILLAWAVANGLPHALVSLAGCGSYYRLPTLTLVMIVEDAIMLLNLGGAVLLAGWLGGGRPLAATLGWQSDPVAAFWGLAGFAAISAWPGLIGRFLPRQIVYGPITAPPGRGGVTFTVISLLLLPAFCQEAMFRGLIQGVGGGLWGPAAGLALAAALYVLRHLPADLHWARVHGARWRGWLHRLLELCGTAVILGLARYLSGSTLAAWIAHEGAVVLVVRPLLWRGRKRPGAGR
jgi:membrane protease YdiL (CAAX protease family)